MYVVVTPALTAVLTPPGVGVGEIRGTNSCWGVGADRVDPGDRVGERSGGAGCLVTDLIDGIGGVERIDSGVQRARRAASAGRRGFGGSETPTQVVGETLVV